jgi:hypothetical protein
VTAGPAVRSGTNKQWISSGVWAYSRHPNYCGAPSPSHAGRSHSRTALHPAAIIISIQYGAGVRGNDVAAGGPGEISLWLGLSLVCMGGEFRAVQCCFRTVQNSWAPV